MVTDEQLLAQYTDGDQRAFAELIRRYQQELFAFLCRFVADAAADDLFQETFLQVHRNAGTFDADRRFRPWLFTIAANKARLRTLTRIFRHSTQKSQLHLAAFLSVGLEVRAGMGPEAAVQARFRAKDLPWRARRHEGNCHGRTGTANSAYPVPRGATVERRRSYR